jgi:predicted DsbA family dithiol-disulfide isomerase
VRLISPEWHLRGKDMADIAILEGIISARGLDTEEIKKYIWSHNPYWYEKGYKDYYFPITLDP